MIFIKRWASATLSLLILCGIIVGLSELIIYAIRESMLAFSLLTVGMGLLVAREDDSEYMP